MILRQTRVKKLSSYLIAGLLPAASIYFSLGALTPYTIAVSASLIANAELKRLRNKYTINNEEVYHENGILRKNRSLVKLRDVVKINIKQGFGERMLGYGSLELETKSNSRVPINNIRKPNTIAQRIKLLKKEIEE